MHYGLLLPLLWFGFTAAAGETHIYDACKASLRPVEPQFCQGLMTGTPLPAMTRDMMMQTELTMVANQVIERVSDDLDKSIAAREELIQCMGLSGLCSAKIETLRTELTDNLKLLRLVLAADRTPADIRDHSVRRQITWPEFMGGKSLPVPPP